MARIEEISVFFPTYNEEGNIAQTVLAAKKVLEKISQRWEIIIVNDGSFDNTEKVAQELAKSHKQIRLITHKKNRGYGGALKTGFKNARFEWVAFTDADGQFDFAEINRLIKKQKDTGADLVLGYRLKRADSLSRKIFTWGWALIARILLGLKARDYSCGFKLIRKKVFQAVQPLVAEEKVTQIEMLVKARKKGFKFAEVGVHHYPRAAGKQAGAKLSVVIKSISDLFELWKKLR